MSRNLQVVGITTSGQIKHCFRKASNGRWQAFFGDIEQSVVKKEISKFVEVSCRPANNDLVDIIAIDNLGKCYRFRQDSLKQWFGTDLPIIDNLNIKKVSKTDFTNTCYLFLLHDTQVKQGNLAILSKNHGASSPFGNISTTFNTSNLPELTDISVSKLESNVVRNTGNEKSFVVAANAAGDVNIMLFEYNRLTLESIVLRLPNNEKAIKVSCSLNSNKLHITAVSLSGNIYHTIYLSQTQWGDIEQNSKEAGTFIDISCSFVGNRLHVVGITNNGRILHTFRNRNGSWQPFFGDIESVAGEAGEFAAVDIF